MLGVEYITVVPEVGCMRMALTYSTIVVITTKCLVNISIHYQTSQARSQESASLEMESNTALISRHAPVITKFREEIRNCKISYIYIKLTTQLQTYRGTSPSPIETTKYAENQLKKKKVASGLAPWSAQWHAQFGGRSSRSQLPSANYTS